MSRKGYFLYIFSLVSVVIGVTLYLSFEGASYYFTPLEERFYHEKHQALKPNGLWGHGLGIIGTLLIVFGVVMYMVRKRWRRLSRVGLLKPWLEFHIFLCTLGPIMVLFHTSFKFGGIVSISFWSMIAVVASGILGRFIYLQIPRTLQGRTLDLNELQELKSGIQKSLSQNSLDIPLAELMDKYFGKQASSNILQQMWVDFRQISSLKAQLAAIGMEKQHVKEIISLIRQERSITRKMKSLLTMQRYFRYWHVAHLPFAIIMLLIMVVHVAVTVAFGYTWIF